MYIYILYVVACVLYHRESHHHQIVKNNIRKDEFGAFLDFLWVISSSKFS